MKEYKDDMTMNDLIIKIGDGSVIQHGAQSNRVYLIKLAAEDAESAPEHLIRFASERNYSKIVCKVPERAAPLFIAKGYILEGYIPAFYHGKEGAFFLSKFRTTKRFTSLSTPAMKDFQQLLNKAKEPSSRCPSKEYLFRKLGPPDIPSMVRVYSDVFASYPFPITDPGYLQKTMCEQVQYFGAFHKKQLVAIASSEVDLPARNAEMTDFATHSEHTGKGLASHLLKIMESEMKQQGIATLYTIARLNSLPMNQTFLRLDYSYAGTLINNTQIAGSIESMNLYYKRIS